MVLVRHSFLLLLCLALFACTSNDYQPAPVGDGFMLGELLPANLSSSTEIANISTDELIETYRSLLPYVKEDALYADVVARIGDLELMLQEQLGERADVQDEEIFMSDFSLAIESYLYVLEHYPDREDNDQVLYLLAKAYDLSGDGIKAFQTLSELVEKHPYSVHYLEAQFRRGDHLFANRRYMEAGHAFKQVIDNDASVPFYENALYMHGWSLFKESLYERSVESFTTLLDQAYSYEAVQEGEQEDLLSDTIRVMAIAFTYLGGANSIQETYATLGPRDYEFVLYDRLGDLYVDKERFSDAIHTYNFFVQKEPMHDQSPVMHNKVIDTMILARQGDAAREEKEKFVATYHLEGDYFVSASLERQQYLMPYLYAYLDETARFYHARAQRTKTELARFREAPPARKQAMQKDYQQAISVYQQFIQTFPSDQHSAEKSFLIAEAYAELNELEAAITYYEQSAYEYGLHLYSEEAAYSAVLAHKTIVNRAKDSDAYPALVQTRLEAQLRFVDNFAYSQFAKPVLLDSIDMLYAEKDYYQAASQSERFLSLETPGTQRERYTVSVVLGHSYFELASYPMAEKAYQQAAELTENPQERKELEDRIASSVYKNAENLAANEYVSEAVDEFLRVALVAPQSQHRENAEYDAATYLLRQEKWQQALDVLISYRESYDPKKESLDIATKVLLAYEGLEDYKNAGEELVRISKISKDQEQQQQSLYLAAEYFEKAGEDERALSLYRSYVHTYPNPFALAIEVRYKLSEMYRKAEDEEKRRYWLEQIIVSDSRAGAQRSDRSRYLAALSRNVFAEDYLHAFDEIKLTLPLAQSLGAKNQAMQEALRRYHQILDYQVQEFSTQALYRIGYLYARLSQDLMESERPQGFDELELEQYEMLLEDEAYPFEEEAIVIHESNVENGWAGAYDKWVAKSIKALAKLSPGRYNKPEKAGEYIHAIY